MPKEIQTYNTTNDFARVLQIIETYTSAAFNGLVERLKLNKPLMPTLSAQLVEAETVPFETAQIVSSEMRQIGKEEIYIRKKR